jgi:hypothetical protein
LKLHIEVRSREAWKAAVWYYGGAHFAGCSWTAGQCGQRAGVPGNGQWRGVMGLSTHPALMCRLTCVRLANHGPPYAPEDVGC